MAIHNVTDVEITVIFLTRTAPSDWQLDAMQCMSGTTDLFSTGTVVERLRSSAVTTVGGYQPIAAVASGTVRERDSGTLQSTSVLSFSWVSASPVSLDQVKLLSTYAGLQPICLFVRVYKQDGSVVLYDPIPWGSVYADLCYAVTPSIAAYAEPLAAKNVILNLDGETFNATRWDELWVNGTLGVEDAGFGSTCIKLEAVDGQPARGTVLLKQKRGEGISPILTRESRLNKGGVAHFGFIPKGVYTVVGIPDDTTSGAPAAFDIVV